MKLKKRILTLLVAFTFVIATFLLPVNLVQAQPLQNGNFVWIWQLQDQVNKYNGIDGLIEHLKSLGISNVCIKYNEGSSSIGGGVDFRNAYLKYKQSFKNAGFEVGTWGYNYFNYPVQEANIINEAIKNSDYYIYDPEVDTAKKFSQTQYVTSTVRDENPSAEIGYSSFPIASYHEDIDYADFNKYCDFASPQIYWGEMEWSPENAINRTLSDYKDLGLYKPIYPSVQSYKVSLNSYNIYKSYGFGITGAWSLDEMNDTAAKFISGNPNATGKTNRSNNTVRFSNKSVATLQSEVNRQGFGNLAVDNIAGPKTLKACPTLHNRSQGNITKWVQAKLGVSADGFNGKNTQYAIRRFQRQHGLNPDGIVGHYTWKALLGL